MDRKTIDNAQEALDGRDSGGGLGGKIKRILPFLGPAIIASIAYVDPGNFATNIQAGAKFGYTLLWVIFASNIMAMLIQALSAKLGIATGKNLAEHCGSSFPKPVVYALWIMMELAAMATDLAEFLGAAVAFNLLFGMPLWIAGFLTALCTFAILALQRYGFRPLEAAIAVFVGVISLCYVAELIMVKPVWADVLPHAVTPIFEGRESVVLAAGILGATVMPHAIFLHSALTQGRIPHSASQRKRLFRFEIIDVIVAMGVAGLINAAMLIVASGTFFLHGMSGVGTLEDAHKTLEPLLGGEQGLRDIPPRLRALLIDGRHPGRTDHHPGIHQEGYPNLDKAARYRGALARCHRDRPGSDADPRHEPGRPKLLPAPRRRASHHIHE
jgi:manganese transport protein